MAHHHDPLSPRYAATVSVSAAAGSVTLIAFFSTTCSAKDKPLTSV